MDQSSCLRPLAHPDLKQCHWKKNTAATTCTIIKTLEEIFCHVGIPSKDGCNRIVASMKFLPFELLYSRVVLGSLQVLRELWDDDVFSPDIQVSYKSSREIAGNVQSLAERTPEGKIGVPTYRTQHSVGIVERS